MKLIEFHLPSGEGPNLFSRKLSVLGQNDLGSTNIKALLCTRAFFVLLKV